MDRRLCGVCLDATLCLLSQTGNLKLQSAKLQYEITVIQIDSTVCLHVCDMGHVILCHSPLMEGRTIEIQNNSCASSINKHLLTPGDIQQASVCNHYNIISTFEQQFYAD